MNKLLPIVFVVIVVIGGWFYFSGKKTAVAPTGENNVVLTPPQTEEKGGVISSIKDAMGLGQAMQCTYTSGTGDTAMTSKVFVSGQKFRSESEVNGTQVYALFDGDMQYTWMGNTKQGTKMSKACLDELQAALPDAQTGTSETAQAENYSETFDTANNVNCVAAGGADFSVPIDVTFTDQCEMMRQATKMMEGIKGQLPAGINIPGN
ncbi:MAG: hypothetical protein Q8Q10_00195 [bacterium]|nr:hypothetical protein [bacterium]